MSGGDAAREEILARVRQAGVAAGAAAPEEGAARGERAEPGRGSGGRAPEEVFTERLAELGVGVQHVTGAEDLPRMVASALWARGAARVAVPKGLPAAWLAELDGVRVVRDDPPHAPLAVRELEGADAAVTRCALAVAETGTLVFDGGVGQGPRLLSALPGHHLCVVEAGQVVWDMPAALAALDPLRPTTWVTGTTRSAAVGAAEVRGVHGPDRIDVVLVD
ncbi:LutC/YkgG family protein [Nocardiopsis potens]|uniref:LutC/YkgG family protein n=1 Tax=Nocardiopsis potens TaxID=1246458 RepID=UPI00034C5938|nr:LUD domain-containing protein [Nocardiopsis potens]